MVHIFSDSQIALSWLGLPPHNANAGRLVHNRLKEIRNIVDSLHFEGIAVNFRYIATAENPADAGTRGLTGDQLNGHIWWTGPAFLCQPEDQWSCPSYELRQEYTSDTMRHQATITVLGTETPQASEKHKEKPNEAETPLIDLTRFSNFLKAKRVVATVFIAIKKFMKALPLTRISTMVTKAKWLHDSPDNDSVAKSQIIRKARIHIIQDHQAKYLTQTYRNNCDAITAQVQTEHPSSGMTAAERRDTELLQEQLQQATNQVLSALNTLTTTVDANMPNLQEEEKTQLNDYLEMVQDTVERATIQRIWINAHLKLLPTMPESI
ncbi:unnamed protein product, partial [Nippostrongylus brasiliensis]|uniref:RNase H domain-containing protein n=1 Tax=Nippostrongylus brasiliensis TaxID=27835 RepID=A0A0N4XGJ5_NIPBR